MKYHEAKKYLNNISSSELVNLIHRFLSHVKMLERDNKLLRKRIKNQRIDIAKLKESLEEMDVMKRALSFYADESKYGDRGEFWQVVIDEGKTARQALKEKR